MFVWKRRFLGSNDAAKIRALFGRAPIYVRESASFTSEGEADNYAQLWLKSEPIGAKIAVHFIETAESEEKGYWLIAWSANLKAPANYEEVMAINPDTPTKIWHRLRCITCDKPVSSGFEDQIFVIAIIMCYECTAEGDK